MYTCKHIYICICIYVHIASAPRLLACPPRYCALRYTWYKTTHQDGLFSPSFLREGRGPIYIIHIVLNLLYYVLNIIIIILY